VFSQEKSLKDENILITTIKDFFREIAQTSSEEFQKSVPTFDV